MNILTQELIKELLLYEPSTGVLTWKVRPLKYFKTKRDCNAWNTLYSNKRITSPDSKGYIRISIFKKRYRAHRIIWLYMKGDLPQKEIDHINHVKTDNRWINLREANRQDQNRNRSRSKLNNSGVMGVNLYKPTGRWRARIKIGNKDIHLGFFKNKEDAVKARRKADIKYNFHHNHGEQASIY